MCPDCGQPAGGCRCSTRKARPENSSSRVTVGRSSKGRKGKPVTTITGLSLPPDEMRSLATELKRQCGSGGTLKDGVIEIQGEHRDTLVAALEERGYRAVKSGG